MIVNTRLREEIGRVFDLPKYLSLRLVESPVLCTVNVRAMNEGSVLKLDAGGVFDCMGQLRRDISSQCPSCGRFICDITGIEMFI